ncbi:MAG: hypothetical protein SGJ20_12990, partial [Planctomycetota bacterium]|nr:hypothetical protein [Planctomycetota bacterium]
PDERARFALQRCLIRTPTEAEAQRLVKLYEAAYAELKNQPEEAKKLATQPIGPLPKDADAAELAAWTTVSNVILSLDEFLMKR